MAVVRAVVEGFVSAVVVVLLTVFLACRDGAWGRPDGAPQAACSSLTPGHLNNAGQSIQPQSFSSPYVIKVQPSVYSPGQAVTVTIESAFDFRGILLQVRKDSAVVGTWQAPTGYKHLACSNPGDSLTHANTDLKPGGAQFTWIAPSNFTEGVKVMATIALTKEIFWTGHFASLSPTPPSGVCENDPCVEGVCFIRYDSGTSSNVFICLCNAGFAGILCDSKVPSPYCQDGTVCGLGGNCTLSSTGTYECVCGTFYSGPDCMTEVDCQDNPCQNGAECFNRVSGPGYSCLCVDGFTGRTCETPVSTMPPPVTTVPPPVTTVPPPVTTAQVTTQMPSLACQSGPCQNGGTCRNEAGRSYRCECPGGFEDPNCETVVTSPCNPNPCNNGTCSVDGNDFDCTCPNGFEGTVCNQTVADACEDVTCKNGGICRDAICECPPEFTGPTCETVKPLRCASNPCKNGGICIDIDQKFTCACKSGYLGQTCNTLTVDNGNKGQTGLPLEIWWIVLIALIGVLLIVIAIAVCVTVIRSSQSDDRNMVGNRKGYA